MREIETPFFFNFCPSSFSVFSSILQHLDWRYDLADFSQYTYLLKQ